MILCAKEESILLLQRRPNSGDDILDGELRADDVADGADFAIFLCIFAVEHDVRLAPAGLWLRERETNEELLFRKVFLEGFRDTLEFLLVLLFVPGEVEAVGIHTGDGHYAAVFVCCKYSLYVSSCTSRSSGGRGTPSRSMVMRKASAPAPEP